VQPTPGTQPSIAFHLRTQCAQAEVGDVAQVDRCRTGPALEAAAL